MNRRRLVGTLLIAALLAGCGGLKFGSDFPSPTKDMLVVGKATKADLLRFFGEPHQVGLDTGDPTWAWTYVQAFADKEFTKQLTVRFDDRGTVKSYSFTSSFPEDMARLK
jgi:outer membrane protein assembly factor BamE (lipoprotein component of BamABCDE complex)